MYYGNDAYCPFTYHENGILLTFDSIYWTVGIKAIIDCIYNGATRILTAMPFSGDLMAKLIEKYKVTIVNNTPYHMVACLKSEQIHKADLSSVKMINFFGGKVPSHVVSEINCHFPNAKLVIHYGITEIGFLSISRFSEGGELFYGCVIKIVDENGSRCGPNVSGEICVKREHQFHCYLDDPTTTAESFDNEHFFRTGDIGHFDENGTLFIDGRKKDVIKIFYFYGVLLSAEVEEQIIKVPGVKEVCVVGVPIVVGACLPAAVVVPQPNTNLKEGDIFKVVEGNKL